MLAGEFSFDNLKYQLFSTEGHLQSVFYQLDLFKLQYLHLQEVMETPIALNIKPINAPHQELAWKPLGDMDYQMLDWFPMGTKYNIQMLNELRAQHMSGADILGIWESNLPIYNLPQVNPMPELIYSCQECYDPSQRAVISPTGLVLFQITPESINQMLHFHTAKKLTPLSMQNLIKRGSKLSNDQIVKINQLFVTPGSETVRTPPIGYQYLNELGRMMVDLIGYVLGFKGLEDVDDSIMAMLSIFAPGKPPAVQYDYASYIAEKIHDQFMNLRRERLFRYTSYIYHLFLFNQPATFSVPLRPLNAQGSPRSVVFWTPVFHCTSVSPYTYCEFIDLFVHPALTVLQGAPPPRLTDDMRRILHLNKLYNIGNWYFYQNHTVIRVYGCELKPFRLPRYVPMRLFALEYFRQFGNSDYLHFQSRNKKSQLKVRNQLGPFLYNRKEEGWKEADSILEGLQLKTSFEWIPYDPNHSISLRRIRYKLGNYAHKRQPEIEQYANAPDWEEGTLVEQMTNEEILEQEARNVQKQADLETCGQVPISYRKQIGAATTTSAAQQQTTEQTTQAASKDKGKQVEQPPVLTEEQVDTLLQQQEEMEQQELGQQQDQSQSSEQQPLQQEKGTDLPSSTEQQPQTEVPPRTDTNVDTSVLQTPQKEDLTRKRERETPQTSSFIRGEKRQRLNDSQEEDITVRQAMGMGPPSGELSASSSQRGHDMTMGGEVSSSGQHREGQSSIKQQFIDIKRRSDPIKVQLYNHLLNLAPSNQQRLMSAFDVSEGKMIMSHFMPTTLHPQSTSDYLRTNMEVLAKDIHPMDKIELHKQTGEMVYASLADETLENYKLKSSLDNTSSQLELERASSQAKDNRIKSLEEVIIEIGHDPKDVKGIQELLKIRDADMAALRKKIKLPATMHPQTDEVAQQRQEKDTTDLLVSLYKELVRIQDQLGQTEAAKPSLEAALKQKGEGQSSQPPPLIINLEEVPPTITPPPQQTGATAPSTAPATTSEQATSLDMQKLQAEIRAMESQMKELDELKQNLAKVNEKFDKSKQNEAAKEREVKALKRRIAELEKELALEKVTAQMKAVLWSNIGRSIANQWQYIETMDEQMVLITKANKEI